MNEYNNNYGYNNQNIPEGVNQPRNPVNPPMAPQMNNFSQPPVQPPYQAPPRQPQQPQQPQMPQGEVYQQQYYRNPAGGYYQPPQPPRNTGSGSGIKVLLAVVITLLIASVAGFSVFIATNAGKTTPDEPRPTEYFGGFEFPTEPKATQAPSNDVYNESDARDKVNADFKGLKLEKKPEKKGKKKYGSSYAFKRVEKSAVGIICYTDDQEGTETSFSSMGSGVILSADGYIVTNAHIINNSRTDFLIKVITSDKKEYKAGVVGYDSRYDLAILKIDAKKLTPATLGDSDEIEVTEDVIVVGNPRSLKYQNSVTKGIVSAVNRSASVSNNAKFIQTDAAINPGNSGGALCNMYGQVIGISTMKIANETYEGMCFAIPSRTVKQIADNIIRKGYVTGRVKIGITGTAVYYDEDYNSGIQIEEITEDGPMDNTAAKVGDVIIGVDGEKISNFADVYDILEKHSPGDEIEIKLIDSETEKEFTVKVKLAEDKT